MIAAVAINVCMQELSKWLPDSFQFMYLHYEF